MLDLTKLSTEARNPDSMNLDVMSPLEIVTLMNHEDAHAVASITEVLPQVAQAIEWTTDAGTSGRLGVLDAAECPPTFGVDPAMVVGLIAGGEQAFIKAIEGAEDSTMLGEQDLRDLGLTTKDVVIGLAASGRTPYVVAALEFARSFGCKTVAVACNRGSRIGQAAELAIEPVPGPEVLTGSTRLKAGTVQKLILNMISTASMVGIGKAYQNLMVDVQQTNEKLQIRAQNIVIEEARAALERGHGHVREAIADR